MLLFIKAPCDNCMYNIDYAKMPFKYNSFNPIVFLLLWGAGQLHFYTLYELYNPVSASFKHEKLKSTD